MDKVDTQERTKRNNPFGTQRMDLTTMRLYWITLGLSILMVALGIVFHSTLDLVVAAIVMIIVIITIKHDRKFVHIPPMIIILIMICVTCSTISGIVFEIGIMSIVQYVLIGMILSLTGFVCAYLALGKIPGFSDERPFLMALEAFTFGVAAYAIFIMATRYIGLLVDIPLNYNELFDRMGYVTLGSFIVTTAFYLDMTHLFKHTVFNFMYHNQEALGVKAENERLEVEHLITLGESDTLEFKSTLRTNLKTGEKDKRMEKAVLKTLVAFLNSEGGTLLINGDEPLLAKLGQDFGEDLPVIPAGIRTLRVSLAGAENADYRAENIRQEDGGMVFDLTTPAGVWESLYIPAVGEHLVWAASFAAAVGQLSGLTEGQVREGLATYRPANMRQNIRSVGGITVIEDCYNAAPESMKAALAVLALTAASAPSARRIAVLGDMKELGEDTVALHRSVGRAAFERGADMLVTVGELGAEIAQGALEAGMSPDAVRITGGADTYAATADYLKAILREGDHVLFKASRSMKLETVAEAVMQGLGNH